MSLRECPLALRLLFLVWVPISMNRWAWLVALLYVVVVALLTAPVLVVSFLPKSLNTLSDLAEIFASWQYWLLLAAMFVSQYALLRVPVRVASRRPVTRGALWPTILAAGLMFGCLVAAGVCAVIEFAVSDVPGQGFVIALLLGMLSWAGWAAVFHRTARPADPSAFVSRQTGALIKGSMLELLVAVPAHIVARHRDYCCAGIMTFIGLATGLSVMLFAFGPAVFLLFVQRWRRLHPGAP